MSWPAHTFVICFAKKDSSDYINWKSRSTMMVSKSRKGPGVLPSDLKKVKKSTCLLERNKKRVGKHPKRRPLKVTRRPRKKRSCWSQEWRKRFLCSRHDLSHPESGPIALWVHTILLQMFANVYNTRSTSPPGTYVHIAFQICHPKMLLMISHTW